MQANTSEGFNITMGKGFHMTFANGYTASVQIGAGNYCDNHNSFDFVSPPPASKTAEIAAWDAEGNWVPFENDDVKGYQTVAEVLEFLNRIANL